MKKNTLVLGFIFGLNLQVFAQFDSDGANLSERNQATCQDSNPEFTAWFFGQTSQISQIQQILGPPRDQGQTKQCYALAAADLLTVHKKLRVSGEQVAHLYYKKSLVGTLQSLFGNNAGGFISSAISATKGQNLCVENNPVVLKEDPNLNSQKYFCQLPSVRIGRLSVSNHNTQGLYVGHQLFSAMDEVLNKKQIVGISYRAQDIFPGFSVSSFNSFANHASTVVARQWNARTLSCDYVIRNTWGESCSSSYGTCKDGYYSVSEKLIDRAVQTVDYIR